MKGMRRDEEYEVGAVVTAIAGRWRIMPVSVGCSCLPRPVDHRSMTSPPIIQS